ncbi:MAG: SpoIVB peptidase S55 [Terracidiphilus sp.]
METRLKGTNGFPALALFAAFALAATSPTLLPAQSSPSSPAPSSASPQILAGPPANPGFFPLSQIHAGMTGTAWTVFQGSTPEPMQVEILGVLRGARGPGQDLILVRLHGDKPEYTGVVEGMSGSPVYIDGKLAGSLSYRIGQFTKEPIAGITPIEQMLEVRDIPVRDLTPDLSAPNTEIGAQASTPAPNSSLDASNSAANQNPLAAGDLGTESDMSFRPMDTPLVMSGFLPEAIRFWQQQTAGTSLSPVAAGGSLSGSSGSGASSAPASSSQSTSTPGSEAVPPTLVPGSAVSMQLIRGDLEVSATCTVTWVDPKQLLACGHPVLGAGPVSLPMTTADVLITLASPLNSFKIVNTGVTVGAFTQDRESAISGVLGAQARMIPVHLALDSPEGPRKINVDVLDLPSLTPTAVQVVVYQSLLESNQSSEALSYHVTGDIDVAGFPPVPLDLWASSGQQAPASMMAALLAGSQFTRLYSNGARQGVIRSIDMRIQAIPRQVSVTLDQARIASTDLAHAGDTVEVEATLRPWHQPARNVRIAFRLPTRLASGNLRLLVSDAATLDRTLLQPRLSAAPEGLAAVLAEAQDQHAADRIYISLLAPETQGEIHGQTLTSLPLSVANALEPLRNAQDAGLNGESAELVGEAPAGGVLSGFWILNLHIEPGGLN